VAKTDQKNGKIEGLFSLWQGKGKVLYSGWVQENVVVPKGAKILIFANDGATAENKRPAVNVCFVEEDKE
jgi:hypothetical protein